MKLSKSSLASVMLVVASITMVLLSDLLIRARGLDGQYGLNARSYDIVATIGLLAGLWGFVTSVRSERKVATALADPIVTKRVRATYDGVLAATGSGQAMAQLEVIVSTYFGKVELASYPRPNGADVYLTGATSHINKILDSWGKWLLAESGYVNLKTT